MNLLRKIIKLFLQFMANLEINKRTTEFGVEVLAPEMPNLPRLLVSQGSQGALNYPVGNSFNTPYTCGTVKFYVKLNTPKWELRELLTNGTEIVRQTDITTPNTSVNDFGTKIYRMYGINATGDKSVEYLQTDPIVMNSCTIPIYTPTLPSSGYAISQANSSNGDGINIPAGSGNNTPYICGDVFFEVAGLSGDYAEYWNLYEFNSSTGETLLIANIEDYGVTLPMPTNGTHSYRARAINVNGDLGTGYLELGTITVSACAVLLPPSFSTNVAQNVGYCQSVIDGGDANCSTPYTNGNGTFVFKPPATGSPTSFDIYVNNQIGSNVLNTPDANGNIVVLLPTSNNIQNYNIKIYSKNATLVSTSALEFDFNRIARPEIFTQNRLNHFKLNNKSDKWTNYWSGASNYAGTYDQSLNAGKFEPYFNNLFFYFSYKSNSISENEVFVYLGKILSYLDVNQFLFSRNLLNGAVIGMDSDDSYCSTFLLLLSLWLTRNWTNPAAQAWYNANKNLIDTWVQKALLNQQLTSGLGNGAIKVFRNDNPIVYPVAFLGDNIENEAGIRAYADFKNSVGEPVAANLYNVANNILIFINSMWDSTNNHWRVGVDFASNTYLSYSTTNVPYYPLRWVQTLPIVFDTNVDYAKKLAGINYAYTEPGINTKNWYNAYAYTVANGGNQPSFQTQYFSAPNGTGTHSDPYPQAFTILALAKMGLVKEARLMLANHVDYNNVGNKWWTGGNGQLNSNTIMREYVGNYDCAVLRESDFYLM